MPINLICQTMKLDLKYETYPGLKAVVQWKSLLAFCPHLRRTLSKAMTYLSDFSIMRSSRGHLRDLWTDVKAGLLFKTMLTYLHCY